AIADIKLPEQAHVLDGDDGLAREGPHQVYLLLAERFRLGPSHGHGADGLARAQHGDGDLASRVEGLDHLPGQGRYVLVPRDVPDVDGLQGDYGASRDGVICRGPWEHPLDLAEPALAQAVRRHEVDGIAV